MNEHEAQRIAAAMHALRPDWPSSSVLTLIKKNLIDRPRRDVTVALSWIACEANSHTPARVLETGPWWRAASVEGATSKREQPSSSERCSVCSEAHDRCRRIWVDDHDFEPAVTAVKRKHESDPAAMTAAVQALKASIEPTEVAPVKSLEEIEAERPGFAERLRAIEAKHPRPALREPEEGA